MRPGVDDGEVLLLHHDGRSWVMLNLSGQAVHRNDELLAAETAGACDWANNIITTIADTPPPKPGNTITGIRCYTFHERDGVVQAELSAGRVHHDGQKWVLVDAHGEMTESNDRIHRDDDGAAGDWANRVTASNPEAARRGKWQVSIGRFPDGTYSDVRGQLGHQRLRRAWNRMVGWAKVR